MAVEDGFFTHCKVMLDEAVKNFMQTTSDGLITGLQPLLITALTIYFMCKAWSIMYGNGEGSMKQLTMQCIKMAFVAAMFCSTAYFYDNIAEPVYKLDEPFVDMVSKPFSYEVYRKHAEDDLRTVARSELDVFDQNRISQYLQNIKSERKNLSEIPDDSILELAGVTKGGLYTLAGVLTFSMFPQIYYPQLCITAVSVPGLKIGDQTDDGLRFIDNKRITGTIPDMVDEAVSFVKKNSRVSTVIDADGQRRDRPEYPLRAVREAVLNALVHRDYSEYTQNTPVSIEMYRDRIVFRSPGTLFGRATVDMLGKSRPEARNAALINMLEILHVTENRYSGIPTMYHELQKQRGYRKISVNLKS